MRSDSGGRDVSLARVLPPSLPLDCLGVTYQGVVGLVQHGVGLHDGALVLGLVGQRPSRSGTS